MKPICANPLCNMSNLSEPSIAKVNGESFWTTCDPKGTSYHKLSELKFARIQENTVQKFQVKIDPRVLQKLVKNSFEIIRLSRFDEIFFKLTTEIWEFFRDGSKVKSIFKSNFKFLLQNVFIRDVYKNTLIKGSSFLIPTITIYHLPWNHSKSHQVVIVMPPDILKNHE